LQNSYVRFIVEVLGDTGRGKRQAITIFIRGWGTNDVCALSLPFCQCL